VYFAQTHLLLGSCTITPRVTWSTHHLGLLGGTYNISGILTAASLLLQDLWGSSKGLEAVTDTLVLQRVILQGGLYTMSDMSGTISCEDSLVPGSGLVVAISAAAWDVTVRNCTAAYMEATNIQVGGGSFLINFFSWQQSHIFFLWKLLS
jgi:hypothetical protein